MSRSGTSTKITGTEMRSDATPHTATAWPVPGGPTLWSVTWLPGRALTRDQAITAMTIAETVTAHPDPQNSTDGRRLNLESWAAELGLSADEAAEMAAAPLARSQDEGQGRCLSPLPVTTASRSRGETSSVVSPASSDSRAPVSLNIDRGRSSWGTPRTCKPPLGGSSISAVRTERTAHPVPSGRVSAVQGDLEPVSGFEPLTVRLQGGCSAC
jgi:hypothetical protein